MAGTVIDQLTVKLGLDPSEFKKGVSEAAKSMDDLRGKAEESGSALSEALGGGAKRATGSLGILGSILGKGGMIGLGIGATIYLAKQLDDKLFSVALSLRQLSIDSKNVGQSSAGLRNLQNASEMAGGSLEDAVQTVGDLQKSLFNLRFNGQVSDQIVMLSRLGVEFQDSYGRAREFNDVMLDTASALEKAQKSGEMTRPEAFQYAQQAGFTGGMAQVVLSGRSGAQEYLKQQQARTQVNEAMTAGGTDWVKASLSLRQAGEAGVLNKGVEKVGEARAKADAAIEHAPEKLGDMFNQIANSAEKVVQAFESVAKSVFGGANPSATGRSSRMIGEGAWHSTIAAAAKRNGVPEEILTGVLRQESGFNPNAVNPKNPNAKGIAQILPAAGKDLGITPGENPATDIDAAARYLKMMHSQALSAGYSGDKMPWAAAVSAYHAGMGNVRTGRNMDAEKLAYPGQVLRGTEYEDAAKNFPPGAGASHTEVNISTINVTTQATDAEGVAGAIAPAIRRQLLTGQAEGGIQ